MEIIPGDVIIEPATNRAVPQPQPVQALQGLDPQLDDAAVRQAIAQAEANNIDPHSLTLQDFAQGGIQNPKPELAQPKPPAVEVPQKFLKPDGAVDVEKIQASTKQLDEAIQKKEEAVKSVDDYMREYNERQKKFRDLPNTERIVSQIPPMTTPPIPVTQNPQNFEEVIRRDYAADPLATSLRLFDLMIQQRFAPVEERERAEGTRSNLQSLAAKDPRILREDVFAAVNAKLATDPDLWKLKNPHKAAFLEVKEEMRLGDVPQGTQALPSRPSPVLGGGTPPSAPSSTGQTPQNVLANLDKIDLRDKRQEALADEAIRAQLAAGSRW